VRGTAFALALLALVIALVLFLGGGALLPKGAWPDSPVPRAPWEFLLLAGLLTLPAGAGLAAKREAAGGALLFLGAACVGLALAWHAGPHLDWYLPGLFLVVLPQAASGALFLLRARRLAQVAALKKPVRRKG